MKTNEAMPATAPADQAEPDMDDMMGGKHEICVPLDSLSMPDEQEQLEAPAVGDAVTMNIEGKVTRIEGVNAYVQPTAVNGQPVEEKEGPPSEEEQMSELEDMAKAMPERY